jgi:hypothetical protein
MRTVRRRLYRGTRRNRLAALWKATASRNFQYWLRCCVRFKRLFTAWDANIPALTLDAEHAPPRVMAAPEGHDGLEKHALVPEC